jgi:hypothetical protein
MLTLNAASLISGGNGRIADANYAASDLAVQVMALPSQGVVLKTYNVADSSGVSASANVPLTVNNTGVYAYGSSGLLPTNGFNSTSYGVDVLFKAQLAT